MAEIKKIQINNATYTIKDATAAVPANTSSVVERDASGNVNAVAVNLATVNTSTAKGTIKYNASSGCIEIIC